MYVPKTFAEERTDVLHGAMRDIGVGIVVSQSQAHGLIATHVPTELDITGCGLGGSGGLGVLRCHFTKPNPHLEALGEAGQVLVIFQGPQAYITPNWYPTKAQTSKVVPTWNYIAVHGYGTARPYADAAKLRAHLGALTDHFERSNDEPWRVDDAPVEFIEQLMEGIVGIEIELDRLEGKWKMSQNRPQSDQAGVVAGLSARGGAQDAGVANAITAVIENAKGN